RLKMKGSEYMKLHKLLTGTTPQAIADAWLNLEIEKMIAEIPDEFNQELREIIKGLDAEAEAIRAEVETIFREGWESAGGDRQAFVAWVKRCQASGRFSSKIGGILVARPDPEKTDKLAAKFVAGLLESGLLGDIAPPGKEKEENLLSRCEDALAAFLAEGLSAEPVRIPESDLTPSEERPGYLVASYHGLRIMVESPSQREQLLRNAARDAKFDNLDAAMAEADLLSEPELAGYMKRALPPQLAGPFRDWHQTRNGVTAQMLFKKWLNGPLPTSVTSDLQVTRLRGTPGRYVDDAAAFARKKALEDGEDPMKADEKVRAAFRQVPKMANRAEILRWATDNLPPEARSYAEAYYNASSPEFFHQQARRILSSAWSGRQLSELEAKLPPDVAEKMRWKGFGVERLGGYLDELSNALQAALSNLPGLDASEEQFAREMDRLCKKSTEGLIGRWAAVKPESLKRSLNMLRTQALAPCRKLAVQQYLSRLNRTVPLVQDLDG
ncbi:MAG: hypothetical protein ACOX87_12555, partial [Chloroflexota bacterium]